ncbi:MAG TPA: gliding motility-associated C-terminal domain-containing protein, partial [Luteibaculaceae bacterium]|nr:gliding motility-associated C-terminal domain-containing protein [Luteibaculaceae bacterium]
IWVIKEGLEFYPRNTVTLFNRWGKEIFKTKGYNNTTNAFDGEGFEDGAYFYVIEIPELGIQKTGYLMIVR